MHTVALSKLCLPEEDSEWPTQPWGGGGQGQIGADEPLDHPRPSWLGHQSPSASPGFLLGQGAEVKHHGLQDRKGLLAPSYVGHVN